LGRFPMHLLMFDIDGTLTETMKGRATNVSQ
jgi:hypothetical protein